MTKTDEMELLTPLDASRILNVSADTVRVLADAGKLPVLRTPSGRRLFRRTDVEALAEERARSIPVRGTREKRRKAQ